MRSNAVIIVGSFQVHLIDQNGLIFGIDYSHHLNVYKIDGNELIKINKIVINNLSNSERREIKIKSENKMNLIKRNEED